MTLAFTPPSSVRAAVATAVLVVGVAPAIVGQAPEQASAPDARPPSNVRMAERLEAEARQAEFNNPNANSARLRSLLGITPGDNLPQQLLYRLSVAQEMMRVGRFEEPTVELEQLRDLLQTSDIDLPSELRDRFLVSVRYALGTAYLRLAQRDNCLPPHPAARCKIPTDDTDIHPNPEAARKAIVLYEQLLDVEPTELGLRWLLNLLYMWIGEHPTGVPPEWLIPRSVYGASTGFTRFVDVAPKLGLDVVTQAGGSVMEDFDADGDLDLMASSWGLRDQLRYFRNNGDGTFDEATIEAGLEGIVNGLNLVHADYDNDGFADVFVLRGAWIDRPYTNSLLRNDGDGTFTDVTEAAGLLAGGPTQTAAWGDYDNDGDLDLFVGNETGTGTRYPCQLFRNNGDGTFTDVAFRAGIGVVGFVKAVAWGDYDNDGRLDLYLSRFNEPNLLFHNEGPSEDGRWSFRDVTASAGVEQPRLSFPTWFFDYDNDGWLDLFVSGRTATLDDIAAEHLDEAHRGEYPRLYHNQGDGTFAGVTGASGLGTILYAMGSNYGDLDNDGFLDLYIGTGEPGLHFLIPNRVFRNVGGARFEDVTAAGGFGHTQKGHAVSFGDIDHDGDQDLYIVLGGAVEADVSQNVLLLNPGHGNAWITLRLEGTVSNRSAIGARIKLEVATPSGDREIHSTVGTGGSFGSSTLQQEIGLGDATTIRQLTIAWPGSGTRDTFRDVPLNRVVLVREGETSVEPLSVDPLPFDQ